MHARPFQLWSMLAIFLAIAQASWIDHGVFHRQNDVSATLSTGGGNASSGNGSGSDTTASSASASIDTHPTTSKASPTLAPTSAAPTTTADPPTSKAPEASASHPVSVPESSSAGSADPTSAPPTSPESTRSPESSTNKANNPKTSKTSTPTHAAAKTTFYSLITVTPQPSQIVITIVSTQNGIAYTSQITTSTTASAYATTTPYLTNDTSTDSSKGMSTTTRNTVIGVVVGLGGVILLGGLFVVAWRVWGRPKKEDETGLMGGYDPVSAGIEKGEGAPALNPFQSTLEGYHQPGKGNVSANF